MPKEKKRSPVYIKWVDSHCREKWQELEVDSEKPQYVETLVYLTKNGKKTVTIYAHLTIPGGNYVTFATGHMCIPKVAIVEIREVSFGKKIKL